MAAMNKAVHTHFTEGSTMDTTEKVSTLSALGQRLREARLQRRMSQEALAQPEFTKSYVSAVERGKARPSLKALELMARRLEIPMSELLAAPTSEEGEPDLALLEEDFTYQLDYANRLIDTAHADEALRRLNAAERQHSALLSQMSTQARFRLHYLRARAYVRLIEPATARTELATAMTLAHELEDPEAVERVRNLIGAAFYQQDMPRLALEQHQQGLHAIQTGVVKDLNLRLNIYTNLANDYWALDDVEQAIGVYHESLKLLDDINNLERQSGIYWGLSLAYQKAGDLDRAKLNAAQVLTIYETSNNLTAAARMSINLAAILIARQEYDEAERLLDRARALLLPTGNEIALSMVYEHYAELELKRGRLDEAAAYATEGLRLSEQIFQQGRAADAQARANTTRTHARALRVAGLVAEAQGQPDVADARFAQAIELVHGTHDETARDIELAYAELLVARGAHEQASQHYRAALQRRARPATH
jgi:tetratricopeptide (TPR) repeat protein